MADTLSALAVPPDATRLFGADASGGTVTVLNTGTGTVGSPAAVASAASGPVASPDGRRLSVADSAADAVLVVGAATLRVTGRVKLGRTPEPLADTADGLTLPVTLSAAGGLGTVSTTFLSVVGETIPVRARCDSSFENPSRTRVPKHPGFSLTRPKPGPQTARTGATSRSGLSTGTGLTCVLIKSPDSTRPEPSRSMCTRSP